MCLFVLQVFKAYHTKFDIHSFFDAKLQTNFNFLPKVEYFVSKENQSWPRANLHANILLLMFYSDFLRFSYPQKATIVFSLYVHSIQM